MTPDFTQYIPAGVAVAREGNIVSFPVAPENILGVLKDLYHVRKLPLKTITAADERQVGGGFRILYVFGVPGANVFLIPYITLAGEEFPSITRVIHEASGYERKIWSFFGLNPSGHPHLRPIILHENWPAGRFPLRKDFDWRERPEESQGGAYKFRKVQGEGIYEIPVGPVHAGIIEPGHFRFSVAGEEVVFLEPKLGYKHKGIEKLFETLPVMEKVRLSERVSGDTSFTHSLAFCQALEQLAGIAVPRRAQYLRVLYSELERIANHLNDIGFIMLDAGYNFGGSNGARLREGIMQWNERLAGSRFLRGVNTIGGVARDIDRGTAASLWDWLIPFRKDFDEVIDIAEGSSSLLNRLEGTGKLDRRIVADHGVIGVAGRAAGMLADSRIDSPYAAYDTCRFEPAREEDGDVLARWRVRIAEVRSSLGIIGQAVTDMPSGDIRQDGGEPRFRPAGLAIGVTEGWRGDIVYLVMTDSAGQIARVDVRDPSFLNWPVVGYATKGEVVPDFPLVNKSFNLSYSGNDV